MTGGGGPSSRVPSSIPAKPGLIASVLRLLKSGVMAVANRHEKSSA
jgi:hypothetical protein